MTNCREAVLVVGFNRPDLLASLLEILREVRPPRLYVAIDGPRDGHPTDATAVSDCHRLIDSIDPSVSVRTRFADTNLGCGRAVSSAIEWFLSHEERGIVLEDDVRPHPSFFDYCSDMLDRYADDDRVLSVNGHNLVPSRGQTHPELPYRFARYTEMWGWALWRRTWSRYEFDLSHWRSNLETERIWEMCGRSVPRALFWGAMFDMVAVGHFDAWDIQLEFAAMRAGQVMVVPNVNLTANVGFGPGATHYTREPPMMQPVGEMAFPISWVDVDVDDLADRWFHRHHFQVELRTQQLLQRRSPAFQDFAHELRELHRSR